MKKLRFAPLIRVSTEKQERQGESLSTQKSQIIGYVESLGGVIPKRLLDKYSGQEHSTPGFERKKFDQLLEDSGKNLFDAVIVVDASRWSRNNLKSEQGLEVLKQNGIHFFVGTTEYDLYNPEQKFSIALFTNVNEMVAELNTKKSIQNKIELAKKNAHSSGKLPYGRTFNKETNKWGIDKKKKALIQDAAKRFLAGESRESIAKRIGMSGLSLWRILNHRSGPTYSIRFCSEKLNIDEEVTIKIPRLLPDSTIKKIQDKTQANKTTEHGQTKNKYLFSRMIFCGYCGKPLTGMFNKKCKIRYYIHHRKPKDCPFRGTPGANELETDVFTHIFWMLGDTVGLKKAIEAATQDKKIKEAHNRLSQTTFKLKKVSNEKTRLLNLVQKGLTDADDPDFEKNWNKLLKREELLNEDKQTQQDIIKNQPSKEDVERQSLLWKMALRVKHIKSTERPLEMSFEEQRELLQALFAPKDGKRFGVFVNRIKSKKHPWSYTIKGNLPGFTEMGALGILPFSGETDEEQEHYEKIREYLLKQNKLYPENRKI